MNMNHFPNLKEHSEAFVDSQWVHTAKHCELCSVTLQGTHASLQPRDQSCHNSSEHMAWGEFCGPLCVRQGKKDTWIWAEVVSRPLRRRLSRDLGLKSGLGY